MCARVVYVVLLGSPTGSITLVSYLREIPTAAVLHQYLKRTKDMFLVYGGDKELVVNGYVDASFDTDPDDSKSQTRYIFILNGGVVSWCSSKQSVVAGSTCEAEYTAASEATNEGF